MVIRVVPVSMENRVEKGVEELEEDISCTERMCRKDYSAFRNYIENTTAHGIARIFSNKPITERLFWLFIVVGATVGCFLNCLDRITLLASSPTSTILSVKRLQPINFPAVTVCNLNLLRYDRLAALGVPLGNVSDILNIDPYDPGEVEVCKAFSNSNSSFREIKLEHLVRYAGDQKETFILNCTFLGKECEERDITPLITNFGLCYTFNGGSRKPILQTNGTGIRQGLSLVVNIQQDQYVSSYLLDAGIRVVIHPQSEPPLPLDRGLSIPPGRNAFIGLVQRNITDATKRNCRTETDPSGFIYLQGQFRYSVPACSLDCLNTAIARNCNCLFAPEQFSSNSSQFAHLEPCKLKHICCIQVLYFIPKGCTCISACKSTTYDISNSNSAIPAEYYYEKEEIQDIQRNLVGVNAYFESLNVETVITTVSYTFVALLSDIGGQLGLFLGISVISVTEFFFWLSEEFVNRCCCVRCQKMRKKISKTYDSKVHPV